jgi:hypothetical protein
MRESIRSINDYPRDETYSPKLFSEVKGIYCSEGFYREMMNERGFDLRYFSCDFKKFCEIPLYVVSDRAHPDFVIAG